MLLTLELVLLELLVNVLDSKRELYSSGFILSNSSLTTFPLISFLELFDLYLRELTDDNIN